MRTFQSLKTPLLRIVLQLAAEQSKLSAEFANFRLTLLILWFLSNTGLAIVIVYFQYLHPFGIFVAASICLTMGLRMLGE